MTEPQATAPRWEITVHNGIGDYDEAKGDVDVDKAFARRMRVVSRETDTEYIEFAVQKESAEELCAYLNNLEAKAALADEMAIRLHKTRTLLGRIENAKEPFDMYEWLARYDALQSQEDRS